MPTHFFNNKEKNTLFDKFKGLASAPNSDVNFHRFLAVVGFFRSSGYFKLRSEIECAGEIRILVGIDIDPIWKEHKKGTLFFGDSEKAKEIYGEEFIKDIKDARYSAEVEEGIMQMIEDVKSGRLRIRIHSSKKLHAKFYLCLPKDFSEHTGGRVIMGSSNISDSGLGITQPPTYELNVEMTDYDDVRFCLDEFEELWKDSDEITAEDLDANIKKTYIGYEVSPFELYMKTLIVRFGSRVDDDAQIGVPDGVMKLAYQIDAVKEGYQMLLRHNGFILADVVGLGKTIVATMVAKRFIEENGSNTRILVVFPPAVRNNWETTFELFGIKKDSVFMSNGSLNRILEEGNEYRNKDEFDMVIVDEAHGFRADGTEKFDNLQRICKSPRKRGKVAGTKKKVMLLTATPFNNRPSDLLNQILLFQNSAQCTIEGIPNLKTYFSQHTRKYGELMAEREQKKDVVGEVDSLFERIRKDVLSKITVRRTRSNIVNVERYREDIKAQGLVFPTVKPPRAEEYKMDEDTNQRFYETLYKLKKELSYARYRAIEFLKPEQKKQFKSADTISKSLENITRIHIVKRLESSFYAFKISLRNLLTITQNMIDMYNENRVLIMPDMNINDLLEKGKTIDEIMAIASEKKGYGEERVFTREKFEERYISMLENDKRVLEELNKDWENENDDPKFDTFRECFENELFDEALNPSGKLVLFSESYDTLNYLYGRLTGELGRNDVLKVHSGNRDELAKTIRRNFDANCPLSEQENRYNIIITTDVLAEGVNLHRANVIVNYDQPWNATKLMQRIGRVNRIGSRFEYIENFIFYPSAQGDHVAGLTANAKMKIQAAHSAFGEDMQVYSTEEILKEFELFNADVKDDKDKENELCEQLITLKKENPELYNKIKSLPMKVRVAREGKGHSGSTIVCIFNNIKQEFYIIDNGNKPKPIEFSDAVEYLKAEIDEEASDIKKSAFHYKHVRTAVGMFDSAEESEQAEQTTDIQPHQMNKDKVYQRARNFVLELDRNDIINERKRNALLDSLDKGEYQQLQRKLYDLSKEKWMDTSELGEIVEEIISDYITFDYQEEVEAEAVSKSMVVLSESFI